MNRAAASRRRHWVVSGLLGLLGLLPGAFGIVAVANAHRSQHGAADSRSGLPAISAIENAAATGSPVKETPIGLRGSDYLFGIASARDASLWLSDQGCTASGRCQLVHLERDGRTQQFLLRPGDIPYGLAVDAHGDVWFAQEGTRPAIGRISPKGTVTLFTRGLPHGSLPFELAPGADGAIWFSDQGSRAAIGRITSAGRITEFSRGLRRGSVPFGITAGSSGVVWFTDRGCTGHGSCAIGRIAPDGRITEFSRGLNRGSQPLGIGFGPDHDVWFADAGSKAAIGMVTSAGRIREFSTGLNAGSQPVAVTAGPHGTLWFTDEGSPAAIGRLATRRSKARDGGLGIQIREYSGGLLPGSQPAVIELAGDGRLWFTDEGSTPAIGTVDFASRPSSHGTLSGSAKLDA